MTSFEAERIRPYGDTLDDGMMQASFTLPVPSGERAKEAARQLALKMGLEDPSVVHMQGMGPQHTYFILYGRTTHFVDYHTIQVEPAAAEVLSMEEVEALIETDLGRAIVVVGACTGTDAHTVGIDAIMNMKGYQGHYGLERYKGIEAYNLGSQVPNEELVARALELKADALLVSQVVTQKDIHLFNLTQLVELLEAEGIRDQMLLICGGPRLSHELAKELGYDAGFGSGHYAEDVATFIVQRLISQGKEGSGNAGR